MIESFRNHNIHKYMFSTDTDTVMFRKSSKSHTPYHKKHLHIFKESYVLFSKILFNLECLSLLN